MDIQTILAIIFVVGLSIFLFIERRRIIVQKIVGPLVYFVMIRTKIGLKFMDAVASRFRTPLKYFGYVGIVVGYLGMVYIAFELVRTTIKIFTEPAAVAGVGLVLPVQIKGAFYVPFVYWILALFVIIVIHEGSHGIWARVHNIKVKSSGFAALGIILPIVPAAFVEPDEKQLPKRPRREQLSVFAAGPFSNIVTGFLFLLFLTQVLTPLSTGIYDLDGITVSSVAEGSAAEVAGISVDEYITELNSEPITDGASLSAALESLSPGDTVAVVTNTNSYEVTMGGEDRAVLGINVEQHKTVKPDFALGGVGAAIYNWIIGLFYWLFLLSLGIGLINLVPVGPIDGGRMFKIATDTLFGKYGDKVFASVSWAFLLILLINIGAGFFL